MAHSLKVLGSYITRRGLNSTLVKKQKFIPAYDTLKEPIFKSKVKQNQDFFRIRGDDAHIYRRGTYDIAVYRGLMGMTFLGTGLVLYNLYLFANGILPKKER